MVGGRKPRGFARVDRRPGENVVDHVRVELLTPLLIDERRREARRMAFASEVAHAPAPAAFLAARFGSFLVRTGRRLEALECRRTSTVPVAAMGHAGGRGH